MALLFCDGFENRTTMSYKWSQVWYDYVSSAQKRTGAQSACAPMGAGKFLTTSGATGIVGFAARGDSSTNIDVCLVNGGTDGSSGQVGLYVDGSGAIRIYRGGMGYGYKEAELGATGAAVFRWGQWNYVEVKFVIDNSAGSATVKVNGETVLTLTSKDTLRIGSAVWNGIGVSLGGGNTYLDDLVVCDGSGAQNNDWMGECRVVNILPVTDAVAAGSNADFTCLTSTDHGAMVDEANPDDDTSYVYSDTVGHIDSWEFGALGYTGTIKGVQLDLVAKKTESGARALVHVTRPTSTNRLSTTDHYLGMTDYLHYLKVWELNPDDSAAWEVADVDGAEFGVKVSV